MDFSENTKIVYNRIQKLEPKNVNKIMGYILLQDNNDQQMNYLARSPDIYILQVIHKSKAHLQHLLHQQPQMEPQNSGESTNRQHQNQKMGEIISVKTCHYFKKGFCKHGSNCRYYHGQVGMFGNNNSIDSNNEEQLLSPGSLQKLEFEIAELLKWRRGQPVSIASLPMLYQEAYGKVLQADGYLTESQRHGKAGYSLTKLLARFKHRIRLIDRPHGQHAVVLVEHAPRYIDNNRNDLGPIVSDSPQLYLTFPPHSTFTEHDVSNYFNSFGLVEDVRIPCQVKRMFGFVTFASSDTVKMILSKRNPHFVCGARVLVKGYRERSNLVESSLIRKHEDRIEIPIYYSHYVDMNNELHSIPRGSEDSRSLITSHHFMENHEQSLEVEGRRIEELNLIQTPLINTRYNGYPVERSTVPNDHAYFPSDECFDNVMDILNSDDMNHINVTYNDQDSEEHNLPDSPFAASIVAAVI